MIRTATFTFVLSVLAWSVSAAPAFDGEYEFSEGGYSQSIEIKKKPNGYSVLMAVGMEGCSGAFEGSGTVEGDTLVAKLDGEDAKDDPCRLRITRKGNRLKVEEQECLAWHGASCDFNGTLRKR